MMEIAQITQEVPPIKTQLLQRFEVAREVVGKRWQMKLAEVDPYFNTKIGTSDMMLTSASLKDNQRRGQVDRIKRVVLALEKLAGIPHAMIL